MINDVRVLLKWICFAFNINFLNLVKILLTGLPLAPVPAISEAFILASTTDATNQAWAVDEHGLWYVAIKHL